MRISIKKSTLWLLTCSLIFCLAFTERSAAAPIFNILPEGYVLNDSQQAILQRWQNKPYVAGIKLITINPDALLDETLDVNVSDNYQMMAIRERREIRRDDDDFSWFGKMDDGYSVFFTYENGYLASKFYLGDYAYSVWPIDHNVHMLIACYPSEVSTKNCGLTGLLDSTQSKPSGHGQVVPRGTEEDDADCA